MVPARRGDAEGPIPGMAGYTIKRKDDKTYCTGVAITMTRAKKVAKGDEKLAAVFAFEFPTKLDFSEKKKAATTKKFQRWVEDYQKASGDAVTLYEEQLAKGDDAAKVVAMARIAQIYQRFAAVLVHAAIPAEMRTGELTEDKIAAYCDMLGDLADPIDAKATELIKLCAEKVKTVPAGWWNDVCAVVQK